MQAGSEAGALLNLRRKEPATAAPRAVSRNGSCVSQLHCLLFVPTKLELRSEQGLIYQWCITGILLRNLPEDLEICRI